MKRVALFLVLFCMATSSMAQKLDMEKLKGIKPRSIGPAGMSGRITAIDAVVSNPDVVYAGAASGGVWKSVSGGTSWTPIFDKESTLSIGALAIQQSNPSVVWVGTGEGNPRNSLNGGDGIYKSLDAGKTWKKMGLEKTRHIHRILIDPSNPSTVYVGSIGSPWGDHPERGVYKTTDGGATWTQILSVDQRTGVGEMVMDPTNPNKLIVNMWEHRRQPWTFKSGGPGSGMHLTYDGGKTWKKIASKQGLPEGELGRMGIAIAKSKPEIVYALVEAKKNGLYRSDDGGENWKLVSDKGDIGNRPFYYFEIYVDPRNENRLYTIYSSFSVSEDGGKNFTRLADNSIHPDHHAFWISPENPSLIYEGNDGGLNVTRNGGQTWNFAENIPVGQFYHVNVDMAQPYNTYGGMQDNGSWVGPAYVWRQSGIRNSYWQELFFGDGFDVSPDPQNNRYGYAMSQGGNLGRYDLETGYTQFIQPTHPDAAMKLRYNWNAAFGQDPFKPGTIYYGSQFVHKSNDRGSTWEIISGDLSTNNPDKQRQFESGGLTMDATGAENHCTILAIVPSPSKEGLIWVGTDDGNVQLTQDGGKTWSNLSSAIVEMPKNAWIPQIHVTKNAGEAYVVVNNYRQFDYKPYLFHTRDFGKTWESLVTGAQVGESNFTLAVAQDPEEPKLLFLGCENGLFVSIDAGKNWTKWTNDFPAGAPVMDLVIHPREHDLVMATFGRAIWVLDDIRPLRELARTGEGNLNATVKLFSPPEAYLASLQQPTGPRFDADAIYNGQNRPFGARITYVINKPAEPKKEPAADPKTGKKVETPATPIAIGAKPEAKPLKTDSIKLEVFNAAGKLINTIRQKTPDDGGVNRMTWNLNEQSERQPARERNPGQGRGFGGFGGTTVTPGTYKLRLSFAGKMDSTMVAVKADPRLDPPAAVLEARYALAKQLQGYTKVVTQAADRLRESKELAEEFEKRIKDSKRTDLKEATDKTKAVKDSVAAVFDYILGKEDKRQGITMGEKPSRYSFVGNAQQYVTDANEPVGETDRRVMKHAEDMVGQIVRRVNAFYVTTWNDYKTVMDKAALSPFKTYEPLKQN